MIKKNYLGLSFSRLIFALASTVIITICGLLSGQAYPEIAVSAFSVVTLMYLVEGKLTGCVCGMVYCIFYAAICFSKGFYGLMAFQIFVAVPMYIVSLFTWKKNKHGDTVAVRKMSWKKLSLVFVIALAGFAGAYFILGKAGSSSALFDGLIISLGTLGTLLLSMRYVEQWYFNIGANATVLTLWIYKSLEDISNLNFAICAFVFVVSNIMALISWIKMEKAQRN